MELRYAGEDKLFVPVERLDLVQKYTGAARPSLDKLGGTTWEKAKTRVKKAMRDMAEELLKLYAARKAVPGHAFSPDSHWQQEFEDAFEWELTPIRPRRHRHQARHGVAHADGSPAVRRRRLRQDRGRDAGGVQSGDGRQAGRVSRAHDRARVSAPEDAEERFAGVPGSHRHGQPLPHQGRTEADARRSRSRQGRHHRRHAPAALEGCPVPRSRAARRRRGTAVRRRPQGTHQAAAQAGRRADDDRDADSADAEHVAGRDSRHVGHRNAAARPARDPDARRQVRPGRHRSARSETSSNAADRCTSSTTASSRSTRSAT